MSFTVRCHATFEAAHHLVDYVGGPEPVHGHSWKIEVALETAALGAYDLSVDFVPTERLVKELAGRLHDRDLNTVSPSTRRTPPPRTWRSGCRGDPRLGLLGGGARLLEVTVWEGPRNSVTYRP